MDRAAFERNVARAFDIIERGATALTEAGAHIHAMADSVQKHGGIAGLMPARVGKAQVQRAVPSPASKIPARAEHRADQMLAPEDAEEKRAILHLRLERAVQHQDAVRVQQLARALDELEEDHPEAPRCPCTVGAAARAHGIQKCEEGDGCGVVSARPSTVGAAPDGADAVCKGPNPPSSTPCERTPWSFSGPSEPHRQHHATSLHFDQASSQRSALGVNDRRRCDYGDQGSGSASSTALVPYSHGMGGFPCHSHWPPSPGSASTHIATLVSSNREQPPPPHSRKIVASRPKPILEQCEAASASSHLTWQHATSADGHRIAALQGETMNAPTKGSHPAPNEESTPGTGDRMSATRTHDLPGEPLTDVYEVEKVLAMRATRDEKREFLIKWKGWSSGWNSWEPEDNILDRRMLRKFSRKSLPLPPPQHEPRQPTELRSKRRCAKRAFEGILDCAEQDDENLLR